MSGYICYGFIDFMLKGKILWDYTNLVSPNEYKKEWKNIIEIFSTESN